MKPFTAVAAVIALAFGLFLLGCGSASAQDRRSCVSNREYYGMSSQWWNRGQLESRWDVVGKGTVVKRGVDRTFVNYPLCGYGRSNGGVVVSYRNADHLWSTALKWDAAA